MAAEDESGGFDAVREAVDGHPMRRLLAYARPHWDLLALGSAVAITKRIVRLAPPLIIGAAIDRVITTRGEPGILARLGLVTSRPIPESATGLRLDLLYRLALIAIAAWILQAVTQFFGRYLFQLVAQHVQHDLRADTYDHMQRLSLEFFDDHQTGGMMSILNSDINSLTSFFGTDLRIGIRGLFDFIVIGGVLVYLSPELALYVLVPIPIIAYSTAKFIVWIEPTYKRIRERVARLNTRLSNNLSGVAVIKSFDRYDVESDWIDEESAAYRDDQIAATRLRVAFFSTQRLLIGAAFVALLVIAGERIIADRAIEAGTFVMFFLFLRRLDGPLQQIGRRANNYQQVKSSAERIFGVLGQEPDVTPPADPVPATFDGRVRFRDVSFAYGDDEVPVLDGISFDVSDGETVGIVGPTGAGKSTLVKLLPRFYDVSDGRIEIDGVDVREYDLQGLRDAIGVVEQNPYVFSGSIRANVAYGDREAYAALHSAPGDWEARYGDRIVTAAKAAGAHEFITALPDGYDTQVGERGVKLSGGQRQRLAIARALLNDPTIIVLDEATSDVDTETEEIIQANLDRICADRTAFLIAHRLSTVRDADRIVVLENGRIVESGTHDELVDHGGTYADLWAAQTGATAA